MRISDSKKEAVIAEYAICRDYGSIAKKYNISADTVKKIVSQNDSISDFISNKNSEICKLIDMYLTELTDYDRVKDAPLNQIVSVLGTLIDKFAKGSEKTENNGQLIKLIHGLKQK